jgi:hypothetical protein
MRNCVAVIVCAVCLLAGGCAPSGSRTTYQRETLAHSVIDLCGKEFGCEAQAWLVEDTLIVYVPLPKLIDDKMQIDPAIGEKINHALHASSRVLLSTSNRPRFLSFVASDTGDIGIDYIVTLYVPDLVKFQLNVISREEYLSRAVTFIGKNPAALNDTDGAHVLKSNISMADFIKEQITHRLNRQSVTGDINTSFKDNTLAILFKPKMDPKSANPPLTVETILHVAAKTVHAYNFTDFVFVEVTNVANGQKRSVSRNALTQYLK